MFCGYLCYVPVEWAKSDAANRGGGGVEIEKAEKRGYKGERGRRRRKNTSKESIVKVWMGVRGG